MKFILQRWVWSIGGILHNHLHLHIALTRRTKDQSLGTFQKAMLLWNLGDIEWKIIFILQRVKVMPVYTNRWHEWLNTRVLYRFMNCSCMKFSILINYRISRTIRRTFFPKKCDIKSTCVLYAEGKSLFPNLWMSLHLLYDTFIMR